MTQRNSKINSRSNETSNREKKTRINRDIRVPEVRLIDERGEQVDIISTYKALDQAKSVGLDLVEIQPNARPPVCRIMDYGKYLYDLKKKQGMQKKNQRTTQVKEIKFRPNTDVGDYQIKLKKIQLFLARGDKVKISLRFRGREMQHRHLAMELLQRLAGDLKEVAQVEQHPKLEGRQMIMVVAPVSAK